MNGLAKIANEWEDDPKHQELSEEADEKWNDHRQLQRKVKLKEKKSERKWTGVAGLAGSTVGGMLGKKTPASKVIGASLGGMIGAGIGYGLADLSFEHFNKDLIGQEALAKRDFDRSQHRLFHYEHQQEKTASEEDDWYAEQRKLHPDYDQLLNDYEQKEKGYYDLHDQLDPHLKAQSFNAYSTGASVGSTLGGLAGLGSGVAIAHLLHGDKPGVSGRLQEGASMLGRGLGGGLLGGLGGGALGLVAASPVAGHYEQMQERRNPELYAQVQAARKEYHQAENAVDDWEYENY